MGRRAKKRIRRNNRDAVVFLMPWFVGLLLLGVVPILSSLFLAFTEYDLLSAPKWVGLKNLRKIMNDGMFFSSLRVTFTYVFLGVPLSLSTALCFALVMVKTLPGIRFFRAIYYLPSLLGGSVAVSVLWRIVFSQQGVFNNLIAPLRLSPQSWIGDPRFAIYTLVALRMWQFGSPMLIFIAGIKQIPDSLYESADLEGAGAFRKFFSITLPMLSPIVLFNAVMSMISAFQDFTPAYIISGGTGGPLGSTLFYSLYLYQKAFASFQMGYAAFMAWLLLIIVAILTAVLFKSSAKRIYYEA